MKPSYGWLIREIKKSDNKIIREVLQSVMKEFRVPEHGTALNDPEIYDMHAAYNEKNSIYYILQKENNIYGGAGVAKLKNSIENICELQKMYFLKDARGLGLGNKMISKCLQK